MYAPIASGCVALRVCGECVCRVVETELFRSAPFRNGVASRAADSRPHVHTRVRATCAVLVASNSREPNPSGRFDVVSTSRKRRSRAKTRGTART